MDTSSHRFTQPSSHARVCSCGTQGWLLWNLEGRAGSGVRQPARPGGTRRVCPRRSQLDPKVHTGCSMKRETGALRCGRRQRAKPLGTCRPAPPQSLLSVAVGLLGPHSTGSEALRGQSCPWPLGSCPRLCPKCLSRGMVVVGGEGDVSLGCLEENVPLDPDRSGRGHREEMKPRAQVPLCCQGREQSAPVLVLPTPGLAPLSSLT